MSRKTRTDIMKNEHHSGLVEVALAQENIRKTHLRWFKRTKQKPISVEVRKSDLINQER